jgi:hypothetical protein
MLWIGQLLSGTGTEIGMLAYPLLILALTHSAVLAGVVGTARAIAVLCLQLPAGALFGLGRAVPFLADAVSYGISFGTVSRIRGRFRPEQAAGRKALWREVADGLHLVWRVAVLRAVVITAPLVNFAFTGVLFTITLALRQHGTSTTVIGLVQGAIAAAMTIAAVLCLFLPGLRQADSPSASPASPG